MFIRGSLFAIVSLSAAALQAQTLPEPGTLVPAHAVESNIEGGQDQVYKIDLTAGQMIRIRLDQKTLDASLILSGPDGKRLTEMNLTGGGEQETLAFEASAGAYGLTVHGIGYPKMTGTYRLEMTVKPAASDIDRKYIAAQNLLIEGQSIGRQEPRSPQVVEKFGQSLEMWRSLNETFWEGVTLKELGRAYMSLGQYGKAIESQERAIAISRELKDRLREGIVQNDLANSYFNQKQYDKAAEYFRGCIAIFRETKDQRREGLLIYSLGNTQKNMAQLADSIASFEQAIAILREVNERPFEGQALQSLGNAYLSHGEPDKAIVATRSAIEIFQEIGNLPSEVQGRINLSIVYSRLGKPEKAIEVLDPALAITRETKNRSQEAGVLDTLGLIHGESGQTVKAVQYFEQALTVAREMKDKSRESHELNNLGLAYSFLSKYDKAIEYLGMALPIKRELQDVKGEGSTFSYLGVNYVKLGQYEKAIENHEKALAIFRKVDRTLEGNELENLGNVYKMLGRDAKAIEYLSQALTVFREVKYRTGEADVLINLADSYGIIGRDDDAIRSQEQALAIYRDLKYRLGEGSALRSLGSEYAKLGKSEKALEMYQQALPIFREVKNPESEGFTLLKMGESKQNLKSLDEAAALIDDSVKIFRTIGSKNFEFGALTALAKVERDRGDLAAARGNVEESLRISESLRAELISPESRTAFLSGVQDSYKLYTDLLMAQNRIEPKKGFDQLAVEVAERRRARSLLDLLAESKTDVRQGADPALVERENAIAKELSEKAQALVRSDKPGQAAGLKAEISQLETDLERAQTAIRKADPNYSALVQPQPLKFSEIQAQLDPDTLLLEYSLGADRSHLWAITKDSLTSYDLPKEEVIKNSALNVYEKLTARNAVQIGETEGQRGARVKEAEAKLPVAALSLSRILLGPASAQMGGKRLVIVADGALQYIPFAMLPDPASEQEQPLIVGHEIASLPSASALAIQRRELDGRPLAPKMLAVIADPVFEKTDERFKAVVSDADDNAASVASADTRGLEYIADSTNTGQLVIRRLKFTRQEADSLLALAPKASEFRAVDFDANRATVMGGGLSQYRYVHFATHGFLDTERPGLSALVLSTIGRDGKPRDGFLRANDIYNMKLPAELVVLSACQTGLGKEVKGEGLIGLTRGFMYAGAKRVVVSLWSVNDRATADLMTKFYRGMLKDNERPAAALRAAQIEMWKQKKWQSPYYWAAFTMQGEWR
ncbi:MAG: tetratricopeptide repeat protein [Acidobacteriota bacterium]